MWSKILIGGLLLSLVPIWRGGQYTRKNGANLWEILNEAVFKQTPHIPVDEAVARAKEAYLLCQSP